ncbi:hypothetical protein BC937DRAFT_94733 [Endogone sp. FLAS-F59071]|nr:hypothetical protein BC937DRAFT_94733 [Endogone sp. FLAS-F59071]|eukprot:RUS20641.1 hypothetical protein BC937DRAFT_94733 [Endogone sp. FLAS-F59071]
MVSLSGLLELVFQVRFVSGTGSKQVFSSHAGNLAQPNNVTVGAELAFARTGADLGRYQLGRYINPSTISPSLTTMIDDLPTLPNARETRDGSDHVVAAVAATTTTNQPDRRAWRRYRYPARNDVRYSSPAAQPAAAQLAAAQLAAAQLAAAQPAAAGGHGGGRTAGSIFNRHHRAHPVAAGHAIV